VRFKNEKLALFVLSVFVHTIGDSWWQWHMLTII